MSKFKTIDTFFKRKDQENEDASTITTPILEGSSNFITSSSSLNSSKRPRLLPNQLDVFRLERDPGMRPMIWKFPPNKRDEIRRAYIKVGPNQSILDNDPFSGDKSHRRFQASWFKLFPSWLEYSIEDDAIYCFPCFLFAKEPSINTGSNAFIENGFRNWKKVNSGKECALLNHIGKGPNSFHHKALKSCDDLMKQSQHIDRLLHKQTSEEIEKNRIRLGASIDCIRWLTFQGCAYRGHDESQSSSNRGNFLEMLKFLGSYNERVKQNVLENAPKNAKYTSNDVQKEILHILATKVRNSIREEIGDAKFCIIVDEARDESKKEQMAIVLRFVTLDGFVKERFFDLVHVTDTCATTLKKELISVLSHYDLQVENIRGQGYDGASNMRGEWNGLQALFLKDSPQAYYVHCFAHRLQLALVAASREFGKMFTATNIVLNNIIEDGTTYAQRGEAYGVSKILLSFEFVFTLHLMKEIMGITNVLCQALQQQSQDILNAMHIVSTSKLLLQQLRDGGWCNFFANVKDFCEKHEIEVPNMSAQYVFGRGRSRQPSVTVEHHYRIDVFLATIDSQIQELNSRFNEQTIELLTLSCALDPKDNFKSFNIEEISKLAEKFYPLDFPSNELNILKSQLQHYQHDIPNHLKGIGTLSELCNKLQETGKSRTYHMVDRLIRLVLTLPVSTATTERAFSAMKIVKTRLRITYKTLFLLQESPFHSFFHVAKKTNKSSSLSSIEAFGAVSLFLSQDFPSYFLFDIAEEDEEAFNHHRRLKHPVQRPCFFSQDSPSHFIFDVVEEKMNKPSSSSIEVFDTVCLRVRH
ncbi:uncharacterized protein LOC130933234 [Arachis stenosperma]|uniref:uncharacterized protein LOC130933234 n=1 Tax=Arachis stenosperma TaxID=217475 RepID=UPI0025AD2338|nr:uncharacterized protein LOC130933234 [Arachis stenosperma]